MARTPCTFRQIDLTRALKAAQRAGVDVKRIEIDQTGTIAIVVTVALPVEPVADFDKWKAHHADST